MRWTHKAMLPWLLAALLPASMSAQEMTVTTMPSESLTVPWETCDAELTKLEQTSVSELTKLETECKEQLKQQGTACEQTLNETAATMQTACDAAVTSAVATERRDTEPRLAAREAEALRLYSEAQAWQTVALIGIPVAVAVGILVGLLIH